MAYLFPIVAFLGVFVCTARSLGLGLVAVFTIGYFNGVIRANYLGIHTTFMFDLGVVGLYLGFFAGPSGDSANIWSSPLGKWVMVLIAWPVLLTAMPINDYSVQLVALRATVWFLPIVLFACRLRAADLVTISRGLAVLNLLALAGGMYIYQNGVEALYPNNAITFIIYASKDIGSDSEYHRIPSTFLSAHAYGGTMLFSLPFLLGRLFEHGIGPIDRLLMAAGGVAAIGGLLMCGARQPVATLVLCTLIILVLSRFNLMVCVVTLLLVMLTVWYSSTNERLQRAELLTDSEQVSERVNISANMNFLDLAVEYPGGAGMGSSVGTSIPYFLIDKAPVAIGMENEYCRILIDQGLVGLLLWLGFIAWFFRRPPSLRLQTRGSLGVMMMFSLCLTNWATAFMGNGTLSSIPATAMLLVQMGVLYQSRAGIRITGK